MGIIFLFLSPFIGMIVGLMPGVGSTLALLLLYPFLENVNAFFLIVFYAILVNSREFSSSVSALNFGLLGEPTSIPALKERQTILSAGKVLTALKNTMIGSLFGMFIGLVILISAVWFSSHFPYLMRSDVMGFFILMTIVFLIFWIGNRWYVNLILISAGFLIGLIGWNWIIQKNILTFENSYLYGGIPTLPLLLGIYAIPKLFEVIEIKIPKKITAIGKSKDHVSKGAIVRGGIIGAICGLIPFIGAGISSLTAHFIESKIKKGTKVQKSLSRLTAAETANNAAQVSILIPLLILGLAVQPSELILLDLLESKQWNQMGIINPMGQTVFPFAFFFFLICSLIIGCLITAFFCYNAVKKLSYLFSRYSKHIIYSMFFLLLINILWIGFESDQTLYYSVVFLISLTIGFCLNKKIDMVPFVVVFLLEKHFIEILFRLPNLY